MTISVSTPVTGGAQTGFTSPTYTVAADQAPIPTAKQWIVSAIGGTQVGVTVHSVSSPFFMSFARPAVFKSVGVPDSTGILRQYNQNVWKIHVWKGVTPLAGQAAQPMKCSVELRIPAGADTADPANVRAAIALLIGGLNQVSAALGDSLVQGSL